MKTGGLAAFCAALVTVATLGATPAGAAEFQYDGAQLQNAQFSFGMGGYGMGGYGRDGYGMGRDRFERRGDSYFYNGYRGEREHRRGWRNFNGFWFPPSAFSFSIFLGDYGPRISFSARHFAWCESRYHSYRRWDNSFMPYGGPRRKCHSPWY
ncbi:MAG: Lectin-like protein BA14k [Devosia sp.]|uniref:BA14K family protein n=1 Tax=Devosia sp. TaxID=1871048 RepID=UPI002612191B|nr:BA14K family protein [Devosia sp.]MDB5538846.1 Lectin-like protein BA14k [Devosia sp.]